MQILRFSAFAALIGLAIILFFPSFVAVYVVSAIGVGWLVFRERKNGKPTYAQDENGKWYAIVVSNGVKYRIEENASFMMLETGEIPSNCPEPDIALKIQKMNNSNHGWIYPLFSCIAIASAVIVMLPSCYPSQLATPAHVANAAWLSWSFNCALLAIGGFAFLALAIRYTGGIKIKADFSSKEVDFEFGDTPHDVSFIAGNNIVMFPEKKEKAKDYAARVEATAKGLKQDQYMYVCPPNTNVWAIVCGDGSGAGLDRAKGSDVLGIPPVGCANELSREYQKNVFDFVAAHQDHIGGQKQIDQAAPFGGALSDFAGVIALLLIPVLGDAQNNGWQANNYLGVAYEKAAPSGEVVFGYSKLAISGMGDGQKTFKDILTHTASFEEDASYGTLRYIKANGMYLANMHHLERVKQDTTRQPESARPLSEKQEKDNPAFMGNVETYYSTTATTRRISEREAAAEKFSQEVMANIRRDFLSVFGIIVSYLFWILVIPSGALYAIAKISAAESAVFSNGFPVFGRLQNWVHGWSAGMLYLVVIFCAFVTIFYVSLKWIINIEPDLFALVLFVGLVCATYKIGRHIIPNKRVMGGQPYSGDQRRNIGAGGNHLPM